MKMIGFFILVVLSSSIASAEGKKPSQGKGDNNLFVRVISANDCKNSGGRWDEKKGYCIKCEKKAKKVVKKHRKPARRRVKTPASQPVKTVIVRRSGTPIIIKQEQRQTIEAPSAQTTKPAGEAPKPSSKWWFAGPGVWILGTYMSPKDFMVGVHGSLVFAPHDRFRLGGNIGIGFGPWEDNGKVNLWIGLLAGIRAYKGLFVDLGLESVWGGFSGLTVFRRMFFFSFGPSYWFGDRGNISLRFILGVRDEVCPICGRPSEVQSSFAGGNLLTATLYF